jgi:hypothetical protein
MVLDKQELIESLQNEIKILLHLGGKITPAMLDYRPTPKQRSTIELLRYLTVMGPVLVPSVKAGAFLMEAWESNVAKSATLDLAGALAEIEKQSAFYAEAINGFSEEELRTRLEFFGESGSRGFFLVKWVLSGHAAYRTQLFCYLKACGLDTLGTPDLWRGVDGK